MRGGAQPSARTAIEFARFAPVGGEQTSFVPFRGHPIGYNSGNLALDRVQGMFKECPRNVMSSEPKRSCGNNARSGR